MKSNNFELIKLIRFLKSYSTKNNSRIWRVIAQDLSKPRRLRASVNISQLNRYIKTGETAVVPGKVLGAGILNHPVTVAAFSFSHQAKSKILAANGRCTSILELLEENPEGRDVRIIR